MPKTRSAQDPNKNGEKPTASVSPIEFIIAAASLRLAFEKRLQSLRNTQSGRENSLTIYAVDSDVVKLFSSPSTVGPPNSSPHSRGYGKVFPGDDNIAATAIGALLAEQIFYHLSIFPIIQLPPHSDETSEILGGIASNLSKRIDGTKAASQIFATEQDDLLRDAIGQDSDEIGILSDLLTRMSSLPEGEYTKFARRAISILLINKHRLKSEFVRILKLYADGRLISVSGLHKLLSEDKKTRDISEALRSPTSIADWFFISDRTDYWYSALVEHKSSDRSRLQINRDANALAHLEFMNQNLENFGGKIVLISGDQAMHNAVESRDPARLARSLIHPRSFLIESLETQTSQKGTSRHFRNSLDFLLTYYSKTRYIDEEQLKSLVKRTSESIQLLEAQIAVSENGNAPLYRSAFHEWEDQKNQVVASKLLAIDSLHDSLVSLIERVRKRSKLEIEEEFRVLQEQLDSLNNKQWNELSISFSKAGIGILYALRGSTERNQRPRNPPSVVFDKFRNTQALVSRVLQTDRIEDLHPDLDTLIDNIKLDVVELGMQQSSQDYLTYLAFALLCAAEGKWYIARSLGERAIEQAKVIVASEPLSPITGREAYFVTSQARRMSSKKLSELDDAEELLDSAEQLFRDELARGNVKDRIEISRIKALRFQGERISIWLTRCHFIQWLDQAPVNIDELGRIASSISEMSRLLTTNGFSQDTAKQYIEIFGCYLFVNGAQTLHLMSKQSVSPTLEFGGTLQQLWDSFGVRMDALNEPAFHVTYLMKVYRIFFEKHVLGRLDKRSAAQLFSAREIDINCVMVYDAMRFRDLGAFVIGKS